MKILSVNPFSSYKPLNPQMQKSKVAFGNDAYGDGTEWKDTWEPSANDDYADSYARNTIEQEEAAKEKAQAEKKDEETK